MRKRARIGYIECWGSHDRGAVVRKIQLLDYDDIVTAIDDLHGAIIAVFGSDSRSASLAKSLYNLACEEAKVLEQESHEKSDREEFEAVHARIAASDTLAKSQGKGLK